MMLDIIQELELEISVSDNKQLTVPQLVNFLKKAQADIRLPSLAEMGEKKIVVQRAYTQLAAHITNLFCLNEVAISHDQFLSIALNKSILKYIFLCSGFNGATHLIPFLCVSDGASANISAENLPMFCAILSLDEVPTEILHYVINNMEPNLSGPLFLGWLSEEIILSDQGEANQKLLLKNHEILLKMDWNYEYIPQLTKIYLLCSYAKCDNRLDIKTSINTLLRNRFENLDKFSCSKKIEKASHQRKVLFINEEFRSDHAMFRAHSAAIAHVSKKFHTAGIVTKNHSDEECYNVFDEVIYADEDNELRLSVLAERISAFRPDVIIYPSLGMALHTIILSNFRFAPIQMVCGGHPSSTRSSCIDFALMNKMPNDPSDFYSEQLLYYDSSKRPIEIPLTFDPSLLKANVENLTSIDVGINSAVFKLSPAFLNFLVRLTKETDEPIHFHFFTNTSGILHDATFFALNARFDKCTVHTPKSYMEYLNVLNSCTFVCSAFPFSNYSGIIDACLLGKPSFSLLGKHMSDQTAAIAISTADFPTELNSFSEAEYFDKLKNMVSNPNYRQKILKQCKSIDILSKMKKSRDFDEGMLTRVVTSLIENSL